MWQGSPPATTTSLNFNGIYSCVSRICCVITMAQFSSKKKSSKKITMAQWKLLSEACCLFFLKKKPCCRNFLYCWSRKVIAYLHVALSLSVDWKWGEDILTIKQQALAKGTFANWHICTTVCFSASLCHTATDDSIHAGIQLWVIYMTAIHHRPRKKE